MTQEVPPLDDVVWSTPEGVLDSFAALYGALLINADYVSHIIPGINKIPNTTFRVITFAIISACVFIMFGANALGVVVSYAFARGIYEVILKWIYPNKSKEVILARQNE